MPIYIDFDLVSEPTTDLGENKRVEVSLNSSTLTVTAEDGSTFDGSFSLVFYTHANPIYAGVDHILLEGGEVLEALPEAAIYLESYSASTKADALLLFDPATQFPDTTTQNYLFFQRARTEFVKCKALSDLLKAAIASRGIAGPGRRTLADFTIDLSAQANLLAQARPIMRDALDQCRMWYKAMLSGGQRDWEHPEAVSAVKSGSNPYEQSGIGRGWITGGGALNSREQGGTRTDGTKTRPRRGNVRNTPIDRQGW